MKILPSFSADPIKAGAGFAGVAVIVLSWPGLAQAQAQAPRPETVTWTVSAPSTDIKAGASLVLTLQGAVQDGWHVYSLKQVQDGPTPLLVSLDNNTFVTSGGVVTGSPPVKQRDDAFGFDTQFYAQPFTLSVPVRLTPKLQPGAVAIPLRVRFQTCNGAVCQPPRTVRLSATVNVQAAR